MNQITEYYIKYFTLLIFIIGFFAGITQVFTIMSYYQVATELGYNNICEDEFGNKYHFDRFDKGTILCEKEGGGKFAIKRLVLLLPND